MSIKGINIGKTIILSAFLIFSTVVYGQNDDLVKGIKTVVIDAGHGGHDGGCSGASSHEKNVTLALALKLGKMIKAKTPEVRVLYTRNKDVFVPFLIMTNESVLIGEVVD